MALPARVHKQTALAEFADFNEVVYYTVLRLALDTKVKP